MATAAPDEKPETQSAVLLEASGLVKHFGPVIALRSADLSVRGGEIHALMGANGAGKSTLVKILTGAVRPDAGRITVRGERAAEDLHQRALARAVGAHQGMDLATAHAQVG